MQEGFYDEEMSSYPFLLHCFIWCCSTPSHLKEDIHSVQYFANHRKQWVCSSHSATWVTLFTPFGMILNFTAKTAVCFDIVTIDIHRQSPIINFMKYLSASACCKRSLQLVLIVLICKLNEWIQQKHATCPNFQTKSLNKIPQILLYPPSLLICYCLISGINVSRHRLHYFFSSVSNVYEQA